MIFLELAQLVAIIFLLAFLLEQLVVPLFTGKPLFWRLRKGGKTIGKLVNQLDDLEIEEEISKLQNELRLRKEKIEKTGKEKQHVL